MNLIRLMLIGLVFLPSPRLLQEIRLEKLPTLEAVEQDFHEKVLTLCRHEGTKLIFDVDFGGFSTHDILVKRASGNVDIDLWDRESHMFLFNPKSEEFELEIWVKSELLNNVFVPVQGTKLASISADKTFNLKATEWQPINEIMKKEGGYTIVIPSEKFYSRACE